MNAATATPEEADPGYDFVGELERVRVPLMRYAYRLVGNEAARDDLVQDTLMRAWVARRRFAAGTSFKAWLFRIARNSFLSNLRRSRHQVDIPDDELASRLTTPADQETTIHLRDLQCAMARLPAAQAAALAAVSGAGDRYEEIAESLGIASGTLRCRVHRARRSLVRTLDHPSSPEPAESAPDDRVPQDQPQNVYAIWKASGSRIIG